MRASSQSDLRARTRRTAGEQSLELVVGQPPAIAEVEPRREHVELEADPAPVLEAGRRRRGRERRERPQRLDPLEGRLGSCPLEHAPHEEHGLSGDRDDEVGLLVRAREVGEVGVLDDERSVEPVGGEGGSECREPAVDLVPGRHGRVG